MEGRLREEHTNGVRSRTLSKLQTKVKVEEVLRKVLVGETFTGEGGVRSL